MKLLLIGLIFIISTLAFSFFIERVTRRFVAKTSDHWQKSHHLAVIDTLNAILIWLVIFRPNLNIPEALVGIDIVTISILAGGVFFLVNFLVRLRLTTA